MTKSSAKETAIEQPVVGEVSTLLGMGSEFSGKLNFDGALRIDGRFSGEIHSEGVLVIGPKAQIEAEIAVGSLLVQGRVTGNITASESIELHAPSRVDGKLVCPQLYVEKGVILNGSCEMPDPGASTDAIPSPDDDSDG